MLFGRKKEAEKKILERNFLKELEELKKKKFSQESINHLTQIFRNYLKEKYQLKLNLTFEEIMKKIRGKEIKEPKHKALLLYIENLSQAEYTDFKTLDKEKLIKLIIELETFLNTKLPEEIARHEKEKLKKEKLKKEKIKEKQKEDKIKEKRRKKKQKERDKRNKKENKKLKHKPLKKKKTNHSKPKRKVKLKNKHPKKRKH